MADHYHDLCYFGALDPFIGLSRRALGLSTAGNLTRDGHDNGDTYQ